MGQGKSVRSWILIALVLGGTACSAEESVSPPTQEAQSHGAPAEIRRYETLDDMVELIAQKEVVTISTRDVGDNEGTLEDFAELHIEGSEHAWSIFFFTGPPQRDLWLPGMAQASLTYGPNWIVIHPPDVAAEIASLFGGTYQEP